MLETTEASESQRRVYLHTCAVVVSSLKTVSDTAIHCKWMQIGRAWFQKGSRQSKNIYLFVCKHTYASTYIHLQYAFINPLSRTRTENYSMSKRSPLHLIKHPTNNTAAQLGGEIWMRATNLTQSAIKLTFIVAFL